MKFEQLEPGTIFHTADGRLMVKCATGDSEVPHAHMPPTGEPMMLGGQEEVEVYHGAENLRHKLLEDGADAEYAAILAVQVAYKLEPLFRVKSMLEKLAPQSPFAAASPRLVLPDNGTVH